MRAEAGLPPLSPQERPAEEPAQAEAAEVPVAQLQPGDQVVDGETGEITTVPAQEPGPSFFGSAGAEEASELPDEDTPSVSWQGSSENGA
jgi:hypothetical protein